MDALLTTFIAAALAEMGDKTQLLVIALAARYRRVGAVILGVAIGAFGNALMASFGGTLVNGMVTPRAISLLIGMALILAGISGVMPQRDESQMGAGWKTGAVVTTAACFFLLEFGDRTQFLTFALAAQYDSVALAAAGATAGIMAANAPAAVLADRLPRLLSLSRVRAWLAAIFLLGGVIVAVTALRLV